MAMASATATAERAARVLAAAARVLAAAALAAASPAAAAPGKPAAAPGKPVAAPGRPPAAPSIAAGAHAFAALAGRPAAVRIEWPVAPGVARYRARWSQGGATADVELPGTATAIERQIATAGHYQLAIVAIDAAGRESPPAELGVDVVAVAAVAPGDDEPAPAGAPARPGVPAFALGARFRSPGLTCRLGDGPAGAEATAREVGAATLRCGGDPGPRVEVSIVIAPVIVDAPKQPIARGAAAKVHLTVASVAPLGARLDLEADGADLADARRTAHGLEVTVTPRAGPTSAGLVVQSRGVRLGRVELAVAAPPPPPPPAPPPPAGAPAGSWLAIDLGYHLGVLIPSGERPAIGAAGEELAPDVIGGGRVGLFPTRRVGLEAELALAAPDYRSGHATWLVSARAHLAARVVERDRFGLRLVGGAGALSTTGELHYGGALSYETSPNLWLRFQALHVISVARDAGYAHCVELQLGVVTRLGRRDRGW